MRKNIIIKSLASLVPLLSFSALALNGNALNCNEKLNVSVDSCSTLASLVPLLALSAPVGFGLRPAILRRCR